MPDSANKKNQPASPGKKGGRMGDRIPVKWIYLILLFLFILITIYSNYSAAVREITWQQFEKEIMSRKAVDKIEVINNETVNIFIKPGFLKDSVFVRQMKPTVSNNINLLPNFFFTIGSVESFENKINEAQKKYQYTDSIDISYRNRRNWIWDIGSWILPLLLMIFVWNLIFRRMGSGEGMGGSSVFSFGKSTATLQENENKSTVSFDDVAGLDEAKVEVKEIVDFLKDPTAYTRLGAKIPKGVIIVGPPGTGKTLLVKAVAGEAKVPFFSISGSEFVEMFVGVGASRVRDLFKRAKEKSPCIVFIDEIDAVGRSRGKNAFYTGANDERESTLNQLLTEMDGFGTNSGVIVLAATNRADMLDPALLRPGRFDRHIYLELPNMTERKAIFKVHMRPLIMDESIDIDFLASQTPGFSGADIANICNEAALIAARRKKDKINRQDFLDAIDRIIAGLERKSKIISPEEKRTIAFHEAGHAVVSWMLRHVDPLVKVSIIPRGKSLGAAWYLPEERQLRTATEFSERLCASLGGRAAEEIMFGEVSSGALDDLEKVTREAYMMVTYFGFNKTIGNISFYDSTGLRDATFQKPYSEETARIIDEEVRKIIDHSYQRSKNLLTEHKSSLVKIAEMLLEKEVIFKEDLEGVLGKRPG